jgi:glycosyltransferase involved in cell wall biosynthesis
MRRFLGLNRVIWFNTTGLRPPRANLKDIRKILRKIRSLAARLAPREAKTSNLGPEIHEILLLPLQWGLFARKFNARILRRAVKSCLSNPPSSELTFLISTLPLTADLVGAIPSSTFIYYLVDDYASWPGLTGEIVRQMDQAQAKGADRIVAASRALAELHMGLNSQIDYLPHGVEVDQFAPARGGREQRKRDGIKPTADVIFFGALDERMDYELFNAVIRARPDLRFLCLGPQTGFRDQLVSAPNLERRPPVPFAELPNLLGQCEVAFMPYVQSDLGRRLAPLKALEALTAGLPVVATDIPELQALPGGAFLGKTMKDLLNGLDQSLDGRLVLPSLEVLSGHSWDNRAERLSTIMLSAKASNINP